MQGLPLIVDIKRHSLEDGPGIRTVVFFKGCPLRCVFCHNPETQSLLAEIAFHSNKCLHCGSCHKACVNRAIDLDADLRIRRDRCIRCAECVKVCPSSALRLVGQAYTAESLIEVLLRDRPYYLHSGGGVTFSGGECTLFTTYLHGVLTMLKSFNINVTIETCGYFEYRSFRSKILPYVDLIYFDIKAANRHLHKRFTGVENNKIISNLLCLLEDAPEKIHPRIPLIPDLTTDRKNLEAIVDLLVRAGARDVQLLPYNPMGLDMYERLGRAKPLLDESFMSLSREKDIVMAFKKMLDQKTVLYCKKD